MYHISSYSEKLSVNLPDLTEEKCPFTELEGRSVDDKRREKENKAVFKRSRL